MLALSFDLSTKTYLSYDMCAPTKENIKNIITNYRLQPDGRTVVGPCTKIG
jgi:hypothetical protein